MSAKDLYHNACVKALEADGWTITDDPLYLAYGGQEMYVDLAAENRTFAAEKNGQKIAVEIKSFLSRSAIQDLKEALGQYDIYEYVLAELEPDRVLYLAVSVRVYENLFDERFGRLILNKRQLRLIVFDHILERIVLWIP